MNDYCGEIENFFDALFDLAECYRTGDGVERDIDRAVELYKRAADNGNLKAAYTLEKIILEQNHQRLA